MARDIFDAIRQAEEQANGIRREAEIRARDIRKQAVEDGERRIADAEKEARRELVHQTELVEAEIEKIAADGRKSEAGRLAEMRTLADKKIHEAAALLIEELTES